jgi:hypothetical protein
MTSPHQQKWTHEAEALLGIKISNKVQQKKLLLCCVEISKLLLNVEKRVAALATSTGCSYECFYGL